MAKEKQIQIPQLLFIDLCRYFLLDHAEPELAASISHSLEDKLNRIVEHDLYTKYKCAPTEAEKEHARKEYLERKGIPNSYRW